MNIIFIVYFLMVKDGFCFMRMSAVSWIIALLGRGWGGWEVMFTVLVRICGGVRCKVYGLRWLIVICCQPFILTGLTRLTRLTKSTLAEAQRAQSFFN